MIAVRFTADRGSRKAGDVVRFDDASAAHIVAEGVAEYADAAVDPVPVEQSPTDVEVPETASAEDGD